MISNYRIKDEYSKTCSICGEKWFYLYRPTKDICIKCERKKRLENPKRICNCCGKSLSINAFYNNSATEYRCKKCHMKSVRKAILKRMKTPDGHLNIAFSKAVHNSLKRSSNQNHWEIMVSYTLDDLKKHLESLFLPGMNWDNYGKKGWEIDHIKPKSLYKFKYYTDIEFQECWSLNNLQPLWQKDNASKGAKIININLDLQKI